MTTAVSVTLLLSLAEALLAEPENFIFLSKDVIFYRTLWEGSTELVKKETFTPRTFQSLLIPSFAEQEQKPKGWKVRKPWVTPPGLGTAEMALACQGRD